MYSSYYRLSVSTGAICPHDMSPWIGIVSNVLPLTRTNKIVSFPSLGPPLEKDIIGQYRCQLSHKARFVYICQVPNLINYQLQTLGYISWLIFLSIWKTELALGSSQASYTSRAYVDAAHSYLISSVPLRPNAKPICFFFPIFFLPPFNEQNWSAE